MDKLLGYFDIKHHNLFVQDHSHHRYFYFESAVYLELKHLYLTGLLKWHLTVGRYTTMDDIELALELLSAQLIAE